MPGVSCGVFSVLTEAAGKVDVLVVQAGVGGEGKHEAGVARRHVLRGHELLLLLLRERRDLLLLLGSLARELRSDVLRLHPGDGVGAHNERGVILGLLRGLWGSAVDRISGTVETSAARLYLRLMWVKSLSIS